MLELKNVIKDYVAGDNKVRALKGIDLQFRSGEFVSILGPSGCGKTTLLNIVGGLDKYTSGDLIINGKSTKDFTDRDWDTYRNHTIGFVFQSYNLIPHQTVLSNVELALTLSGVPKAERKSRAIEALEKVGLKDHLNKKPNQLSGGQMQRVAIARALVNNPDIILADEPTGALDTETSIQVMEILKSISTDKLVIMVTHNPELADAYSSRIIRMLDGKITGDSMPLSKQEYERECENCKEKAAKNSSTKKPSMSLWTAFKLSLKNLFTKKGRTTLTAFAGSIGIIGISLILAVSQGTTTYINHVQETTLSSYPLSIQESEIDFTKIINSFINANNDDVNHGNDEIYKKPALYNIINSINSIEESKNDLKKFKSALESEMQKEGDLYDAVNGISYAYNYDMLIYTKNPDGNIIKSDIQTLLKNALAKYAKIDPSDTSGDIGGSSVISSLMGSSSMFSMSSSTLWEELLPGKNGETVNPILNKQYDLIYGDWPNDYNQVLLVADENNEISDLTLYALGLLPEQELDNIVDAAINGTKYEKTEQHWSYEEICAKQYYTVLPSSCYIKDQSTGKYVDLRESEQGLKILYEKAFPLKVTGIIRPKKNAEATMLNGSICYTTKLTKFLIEQSKDVDIIKTQLDDTTTDIFTGLPFKSNTGNLSDEQKKTEFIKYVNGLNAAQKAELYVKIACIPSEEQMQSFTEDATQRAAKFSRETKENMIINAICSQTEMSEDVIKPYVQSMSDEEIDKYLIDYFVSQSVASYASMKAKELENMSETEKVSALENDMQSYTDKQFATYYDETIVFSDSTLEDNYYKLGYVDIDSPSTINIYATSFDNKDVIIKYIDSYNRQAQKEEDKISYTDYVGLIMNSVTLIIDAITYVLIAFVAISLIVSSIMIAVITLISVQERTKEIGILRSLGASKSNVSNMFNAETVIIGFSSGVLGILITYLLCIPINLILHALTGIPNLNALLKVPSALLLILISMLLTLISGLIPSRSAAKKDPVVALRTE